MGYVDGMSLYEYVRSCPTGLLDPYGLAATTAPAGPTTRRVTATLDTAAGTWEVAINPIARRDVIAPGLNTVAVQAYVAFWPSHNREKCPATNKIRFIQAVKIANADGSDYRWPADDNTRVKGGGVFNGIKSGHGWFIDHRPGNKGDATVSIYYNDHAGAPQYKQDGVAPPDPKADSTPALLYDLPRWDVGMTFEAETVAQDANTGKYLSSLRWGFTSRAGDKFPTVTGPTASDAPSTDFVEAVEKFKKYYGK